MKPSVRDPVTQPGDKALKLSFHQDQEGSFASLSKFMQVDWRYRGWEEEGKKNPNKTCCKSRAEMKKLVSIPSAIKRLYII